MYVIVLFFLNCLFFHLFFLQKFSYKVALKFIFPSVVFIMFLDNFQILRQVYVINITNLDFFLLILCFCLFVVSVSLFDEVSLDVNLLLFFVLLGVMIIILSDHLLVIYIGIELQTFSIFILIAKNKISIKGSEASLKYFILGAISSGLYLLGLYFIFLSNISVGLQNVNLLSDDYFDFLGILLICISLGFKLGLSPFHFWLPDIYEGSSWGVLSLLSTIPKISIVSVIIKLIFNSSIITPFCILSIVIGTIGALNQSKLKRLLAYSSISHMGFLLLSLTLVDRLGYEISLIYILVYMLIIISFFVLIVSESLTNNCYIVELSYIQNCNKIVSLSWLILLLSIAGIPPLAGFVNKWLLIWNIMSFDYIFSSFIAILFSIIGAIYYLRLVKIIYFQSKNSYLSWDRIIKSRSKSNEMIIIFNGVIIFFNLFLILNLIPLINFMDSFVF